MSAPAETLLKLILGGGQSLLLETLGSRESI
jgi:hypothetical protein